MSSPPDRRFASTKWTLVMSAARESTPGAGEALGALCELYWPALYGYARRCGYSVEEAQDLTQGFFVLFIERKDVAAANPARGRFRSFLITAFKHFLSNERDRQRALKRGGGYTFSTFDTDAVEGRYVAETSKALTPESLYEREWALGIIERARAALRAECVEAGKVAAFTELQGFLVGEKSPGGYADVARKLGTTEGAVKVTVHRLRRRLRELLKAEVLPTVGDDAEVEEEIRYLMSVLAS